jgi:hypothetical protein
MQIGENKEYVTGYCVLEAEIIACENWMLELDLQLPEQSVPITTKVVSSNPTYCDVYSIQHYAIKFVSEC